MKRNWRLQVIAVLGGGAITWLALVLVAYQYGNQPSVPDMGLAGVLGAAIVGALSLV